MFYDKKKLILDFVINLNFVPPNDAISTSIPAAESKT